MRVICGVCSKELGEVCPGCSSADIQAADPGYFFCGSCSKSFYEGRGGVIQGVCSECAAAAQRIGLETEGVQL